MKILIFASLVSARKELFSDGMPVSLERVPAHITITKEYGWAKTLLEEGNQVTVVFYEELNVHQFEKVQYAIEIEQRKLPMSTRLKTIAMEKWKEGVAKRMIEMIENLDPSIIFFFEYIRFASKYFIEHYERIQERKLILMQGASPLLTVPISFRVIIPMFNFVVCNDQYHKFQWLELGAKKAIDLPMTAYCPRVRNPKLSAGDRSIEVTDIVFIGRLDKQELYTERGKFLIELAQFDLGIWSDNEEHIPIGLKKCYQGQAHGEILEDIYRDAKICLNFHGQTMQSGGNLRTFEIPGAGGFQVIDRYRSDWFEEGSDIVSFLDSADMVKKVKYFLGHTDKISMIANNGREKVLSAHTYTHRIRKLMDIL